LYNETNYESWEKKKKKTVKCGGLDLVALDVDGLRSSEKLEQTKRGPLWR